MTETTLRRTLPEAYTIGASTDYWAFFLAAGVMSATRYIGGVYAELRGSVPWNSGGETPVDYPSTSALAIPLDPLGNVGPGSLLTYGVNETDGVDVAVYDVEADLVHTLTIGTDPWPLAVNNPPAIVDGYLYWWEVQPPAPTFSTMSARLRRVTLDLGTPETLDTLTTAFTTDSIESGSVIYGADAALFLAQYGTGAGDAGFWFVRVPYSGSGSQAENESGAAPAAPLARPGEDGCDWVGDVLTARTATMPGPSSSWTATPTELLDFSTTGPYPGGGSATFAFASSGDLVTLHEQLSPILYRFAVPNSGDEPDTTVTFGAPGDGLSLDDIFSAFLAEA